jgi:hypothetical protein
VRFRELIHKLAVLHELGVPAGESKLGSSGFVHHLSCGGGVVDETDATVSRLLRQVRRPNNSKKGGFLGGIFKRIFSRRRDNETNDDTDDPHLLKLSLTPSQRLAQQHNNKNVTKLTTTSKKTTPYQKLNRWQFRLNVDVNLATRELAAVADEIIQSGVIERACEYDPQCCQEYTENIMKLVNTISKWSA